jgi:hypothetical protein
MSASEGMTIAQCGLGAQSNETLRRYVAHGLGYRKSNLAMSAHKSKRCSFVLDMSGAEGSYSRQSLEQCEQVPTLKGHRIQIANPQLQSGVY